MAAMAEVLDLDAIRRDIRQGARQQADALRTAGSHGRSRPRVSPSSRSGSPAARTIAPTARPVRTDGSAALALAPAPEVAPAPRPAGEQAPKLSVVPRRKRAFRLAALAFVVVFLSMLALTIFEIRIAQNQLELDRTNSRVDQAQLQFDQLRKLNAQLRSPDRLVTEAARAGMVPGRNGEFLIVDPAAVAAVRAAQGATDDQALSGTAEDPFADHERVKAAIAGATP